MRPDLRAQQLPPNVVPHWYSGGPALAAWRGLPPVGERSPEEWIGATVHRFGEPGRGPASLADGTLLRDAVGADPAGWTGGAGAFPGDTGVLVKLLDAGQRLPVHVHPTRAFATTHLDCPYGKTEAWYVLEAAPGAAVWVGWRDDVDPERLARLVAEQDAEAMLALMHEVPVTPGDGILVPGGTPHAIGAGVLVIEAQEPTDQSILLERTNTTASDDEVFLGLEPAVALSCVDPARLEDVGTLIRQATSGPVLPPEAAEFFRMDLVSAGNGSVPAGFAVLVVVSGAGELVTGAGSDPVAQGQAWVLPAAAGDWRVTGDARVLACRAGTTWPPPSTML